MKNKFKFLFSALFLLGMNAAIAFECPVTQCGVDCEAGSTCSITQYDNGELCSHTICTNNGPIFVE